MSNLSTFLGGSVPKEYINPVMHGLQDSMRNGVLAGYPVVDVKAKLYDGSYHDVDSDENDMGDLKNIGSDVVKTILDKTGINRDEFIKMLTGILPTTNK